MTTAWGSELRLDRPVHPCWIEVVDRLGCSVDADGSNGLTRVSPDEAARRGVYAPPGAASVPLVAYHPADLGPRSSWEPAGRLPMGLDAPENGLRVMRNVDGAAIGYRCFGVLAGEDGQPYVQGAEDPAPGAYLSTTSLVDGRWPPTSPNRYFDSVSTPGWVLPHDLDEHQVHVGDLALLEYQGAEVWAQCFDVGNAGGTKIELSVGTCDALDLPSSNARSGGSSGGVKVWVLPGSRAMYWDKGRVRPLSHDQIQDAGRVAARAAGLRIGD